MDPALRAESPLHLEDHLEAAHIVGSEVPQDVPAAVEWRFDEPQPDWKTALPFYLDIEPVKLERTGDALRLVIDEGTRDRDGDLGGGIYADVPGWRREEWAYVSIEARSKRRVDRLGVAFNLEDPSKTGTAQSFGERVPVINDGAIHTYQLRADRSEWGEWESDWRQLIVWAGPSEPTSIDILSISVISKEAVYAGAPVGVTTEVRNNEHRATLYSHAPGRLEYRIEVPVGGRFDVGLGVVRNDVPVTFRVTASSEQRGSETLLEETYADQEKWAQHSVDLTHLEGQAIRLALEAEAPDAGTVALWGAPTVSGARTTAKPNVIFYIIDGAGADSMSLYGYNRRTTPNLERLAAEGTVFENAYSNSSWTRTSTVSYLTSLQHSVLGGLKGGRNSPPREVLTTAEHLKQAGYQTAFYTSNPNAGTMSQLERGVSLLREAGVEPSSVSSVELHESYWRWRDTYPAEPYWVRFQTTDVHGPNQPVPPFAGIFVGPELRKNYSEWDQRLGKEGGVAPYSDAFEKTGIDRLAFFNVARGLYDETMAHQDYHIGQFVERLKATGEWERTIFIVASDHGHAAGSRHFGLGLLDPLPPMWEGAMFSSFQTRIPMVFIGPGIKAGQRLNEPVSMIDMLPTILDLVDLPRPEVMQGQSLAPLLRGEPGWEQRPVILDEFKVTESGEYRGWIEMVDGRWGASLLINPSPDERRMDLRGHREPPLPGSKAWEDVPESVPRLLLYDLWNDPAALHSLHEDRPGLVQKYTRLLEKQWAAHQALAKRFTRSTESPLTPEQLRTLQSLGYIQ
ncbi:MAG: sulfatase [Vicinamibacteria bacterium]